jgi:hypothetical protein
MKTTRSQSEAIGRVVQATPEQWAELVKVFGAYMATVPLLAILPLVKGESGWAGILVLNPEHGFAKN